MNTPTETLIKALRILASDIQSEDGVANTAILEAAQRIGEDQEVIFQAGESIKILRQTVKHRNETIDELKLRIKRLEEALEATAKVIGPRCKSTWVSDYELNHAWELYIKAKEAKP